MPGNRAIYDRAMEQSREAARQKLWDEALKQAVRALQEFSGDADARSSAAVALFNTGKYAQALQLFEDLRRNDSQNPFYLEYLAQGQERLGNTPAAIAHYGQLADLQQSRRLLPRAAEALREVLRLDPEADEPRQRLARLLEETGSPTQASSEYLMLARRAQARGQLDHAVQLAETALRLDTSSSDAKDVVAGLHGQLAERAISTPMASGETAQEPLNAGMPALAGTTRAPQLAIEKIVAEAQTRQEAGDIDGALEMYDRAIALGMERSDVFYSLGLLRQERGEHENAVAALQRASFDSEYALSAHYALGQSYQALGQLDQAAQEYEQTIRLVDLASIGRNEAEDLIQMYESAVAIYTQKKDIARAASLYSTLATFLAGKRWGKERADEFRQRAKELTDRNMLDKLRSVGTGALTAPEPRPLVPPPAPEPEMMPETWGKLRPITDFLRPDRGNAEPDIFAPAPAPVAAPSDALAALPTLPETEQIMFAPVTPLDTTGLDDMTTRYVAASERYIDQGLMLAAMDACMEVIRLAPNFLPIHMRMGEIHTREGRNDEALAKYQLLIDTYLVRDEARRAIDVYYKLIELAPETVNARSRLAELLRAEQRMDEAAEQLAFVANASFRMGQTNKALEEYRRGLQMAPNNASLRAQYGHVLLKLERYEAALSEFRRALELRPNDPAGIARINAALALMGEQPLAVWQSLASLIERIRGLPADQQSVTINAVQSEYRSALAVGDSAILHYIFGVIQQLGEQHTSALLSFEQAADLLATDEDPILTPVLLYQAMADSSIALGQAEDALAQLQKAEEYATTTPEVHQSLRKYSFAAPLSRGELVRRRAEASAALGDMAGAEQALREAKRLLPHNRAVHTKLADVYFRQGRLNDALAQLDELATYYESRQDLDRAIEVLEYGDRLAPNNIANSNRLAQMNMRRGYLDKGLQGLERVAELQRRAGQIRDAVMSLQQVGETYWTLGNHARARDIYDKITRVAPNDIEARQWLSFMYTLAGRTREAITEKKQIVRIFLQQRDLDGAIAELHQIYGLDQNDHETLFQLGDALMRREEYEQAVRTYARLAKLGVETERVEALQAAAQRMLAQQQQVRAKGS